MSVLRSGSGNKEFEVVPLNMSLRDTDGTGVPLGLRKASDRVCSSHIIQTGSE